MFEGIISIRGGGEERDGEGWRGVRDREEDMKDEKSGVRWRP